MKRILCLIIVVVTTAFVSFAQKPAATNSTERDAITNLRSLAMAESHYAIANPTEGFACDLQTLTNLEWPNSPVHARLVQPVLLTGIGQYKFSARCDGNSKPAGKLFVFAEPLDSKAGLPTYCATGRFHRIPSVGTSEFPIRKLGSGSGETCLGAGQPLQ